MACCRKRVGRFRTSFPGAEVSQEPDVGAMSRRAELDVRLRAAARRVRQARKDLRKTTSAWVRMTTSGTPHAFAVAVLVGVATWSLLFLKVSYDVASLVSCSSTVARLRLALVVAPTGVGAAVLFASWWHWLSRRRARSY